MSITKALAVCPSLMARKYESRSDGIGDLRQEAYMAEDKDYFGEKLRLAERARERLFQKLDQALLAQMRQQDRAAAGGCPPYRSCFASILVPVDFSPYAANALRYALAIAVRCVVWHRIYVIPRETTTHALSQRLGHRDLPFFGPLRSSQSHPAASAIRGHGGGHRSAREQAYTALQAFLPAQIAHHTVELRVLVGQPFERILETAAHEKVALIVLGTHGRTV